ncbi:alanine acetyltransferase [Xanthomonas maliensis]|uniref:alanine acetyltransferase n=1 Tax=Xanthomonas maliensis TaxID=1321368 RepID=UPI001264F08F|nr:alanine acetyltransferase [Xanthomonas maliensis]KAB7765526.1 alanine acetyltransferase [Xanthomonas maliensis]
MNELAAGPGWSDLQVACLQAMGHTVYLDRAAVEALPAPVAAANEAGASPASAPLRPASPSSPPLPRSAPPAMAEPARAPVAAAAPSPPRRGRVMPDRLQIALLRACGCDPSDPRTQALMASWPLDELRRDPAAKRALWPQLRALRRQSRTA